jgi:hypothetical protein
VKSLPQVETRKDIITEDFKDFVFKKKKEPKANRLFNTNRYCTLPSD